MNRPDAWKIAMSLLIKLEPACRRIEIVGSLRRLRPDVKDIDLLIIPDPTRPPMPRAEWGKPIPPVHKTQLDRLIAEMESDGAIAIGKNGDSGKRFFLKDPGIAVELYIVIPPAQWGVKAVIRTGPSDFSHWIVTRRKNGGALPNGYRVQDGAVWEGERKTKDLAGQNLIGFDDEKDFLNFLGLGWIDPSERVARWKS